MGYKAKTLSAQAKTRTKSVKAPKPRQSLRKSMKPSKAVKIDVPRKPAVAVRRSTVKKKTLKNLNKIYTKEKKSVIGMVQKTLKRPPNPKAHNFLTAYLAMQRPTTGAHLYFNKGISDFLLGLVIGVLVGIVIASAFT